jgi:hypothetical protein
VKAVNTRGVGQTEPRGAKNDRTIVLSFKSSHEERYMVAQNSGVVMQTAKAELIYDGGGWECSKVEAAALHGPGHLKRSIPFPWLIPI